MGDPNPLISVVLPFYNAPFLKESIESLLNQTHQDFELILVDNGSTDSSVEIAKSYKDQPKVKLLYESRKGVVFAANKGIENARGRYIARMDADDLSKNTRLECQFSAFQRDPSLDVVSGQVEYLGPADNQGFIHYVDWLNSIKTSEAIKLNQFVEFPLANPTLMFKKDVFEAHGGYREGDFPEDYELFLRWQSADVKMDKVQDVVLAWRDSESRLTRTDKRYTSDAFFRVKGTYLAKWLKQHNPFHPNIYIWGAGRLSRRRSDYLLHNGVSVIKYIDFKESEKVMHFNSLPSTSEAFVVSFVGNRGARNEIRSYLNNKGYKEGISYIMAS